jgi:putative membrane protein
MRNIKLVGFLAVIIAGTFIFMRATSNNPSVRGQDPNVTTRGTNTAGAPIVGTSGSTDTTSGFLANVAEMNAAESALAALAVKNAAKDEIRTFAAELERDHKTASEELRRLAAAKNWAFPQSLDALQAQALQGLQQARGPEFDRAFIDAMITSHEKAVATFRSAAASASDADVKAFASRQLPTLENHLNHARSLK